MKTSIQELKKQHAYYNEKFFSRWARLYDYEKYILTPLRNKAASMLDLPKGSSVIDVATGTGALAYSLAKKDYDVTGIDLSNAMLAQAKKKISQTLNLRFIHGDATQLPFPSNTFDAASISAALHDMPYEMRLLVLKEMKRVVKQDGKLLITDYLEPVAHPLATIVYKLARKYETFMFEDYIRRGMKAHLSKVGLTPQKEIMYLGINRIALCLNKK
ncbi:methyltransferase domain-containing protein [Candidatus Gottesmanbacteria bacterium]|nr:methyltransferase domain-containing protein [Candidatus Gottesmanbacteria bacterium]